MSSPHRARADPPRPPMTSFTRTLRTSRSARPVRCQLMTCSAVYKSVSRAAGLCDFSSACGPQRQVAVKPSQSQAKPTSHRSATDLILAEHMLRHPHRFSFSTKAWQDHIALQRHWLCRVLRHPLWQPLPLNRSLQRRHQFSRSYCFPQHRLSTHHSRHLPRPRLSRPAHILRRRHHSL